MKKIGITSTIPVEVVYAAGCVPVDLNNIFITSENASAMVAEAEYEGYPRNACGWIKGIYSAAKKADIDALIAVVEGDCSQTQAMVETLEMAGIKIIPFAYPYGRDRNLLRMSIGKLIDRLETTWEAAYEWKARLDTIRHKVAQLDELTWRTGTISSFENHYYQINCSDFMGNPDAFEDEVERRLTEANLQPVTHCSQLKLGFVGIPPIFTDFYQHIESLGARVVYNEVVRQFAMPYETTDLVEQYTLYTYPYDVFGRIEDINRETQRRRLTGLIHYTQSFCFRQIQDLIIRSRINVPILTIEGDAPTKLDARTKVRIESFIEMLS
jgi:benzoyl-CoA reductase/2-hydroxyglutaryl-CoA dehydratase subunit BcrC/BadD/HgdB